jgi:hypothetical protein
MSDDYTHGDNFDYSDFWEGVNTGGAEQELIKQLKARIKELEYLPDELSNDSPFNTGWNDCVRLIKQHRSKK